MSSTVIDIPDGEGVAPCSKEKKEEVGDICCRFPIVLFFKEMKSNKHMMRKVIHSIKVGVALVFVSLLYLINPLYEQVGENAMWAIMTVVVVFEFFAGDMLNCFLICTCIRFVSVKLTSLLSFFIPVCQALH